MTSHQKSDSINQEQSCRISSRSDLKRRNLKFLKRSLQQEDEQQVQEQHSEMIWYEINDMRSVSDLVCTVD